MSTNGSTGFARLDFVNGGEKARCCTGPNQGAVFNKDQPCSNPFMELDEQACVCTGVGFAFYEVKRSFDTPIYVQIPGDCRWESAQGALLSQQVNALMPFRMYKVTVTYPDRCGARSNVSGSNNKTYYKFVDARGYLIGLHVPVDADAESAPRFLNYYDSTENVNSASQFGTTRYETEEALCFGFDDDEKESLSCVDDEGKIVCRCKYAMQVSDRYCLGPSSFPCENEEPFFEYIQRFGLYDVPPDQLFDPNPMFCVFEEEQCIQ